MVPPRTPRASGPPAPTFAPPRTEAPDGVQLSLALDAEACPDWPAVRYFENRGLHHRHWKAARRLPWLQVNAENSLAALAYMDVARSHYEALVAAWLPPATWTVLDAAAACPSPGRFSGASTGTGGHGRGGGGRPAPSTRSSRWRWERWGQVGPEHRCPDPPTPTREPGRQTVALATRRLDGRALPPPAPRQPKPGSGVVTAGAPEKAGGRAVGGLASGTARQVIAAERRTLVADLVGKGLSTREIAAVVEVRTGRRVAARSVRRDRKALGLEGIGRTALVTGHEQPYRLP